jgi:hypothetical protein
MPTCSRTASTSGGAASCATALTGSLRRKINCFLHSMPDAFKHAYFFKPHSATD